MDSRNIYISLEGFRYPYKAKYVEWKSFCTVFN